MLTTDNYRYSTYNTKSLSCDVEYLTYQTTYLKYVWNKQIIKVNYIVISGGIAICPTGTPISPLRCHENQGSEVWDSWLVQEVTEQTSELAEQEEQKGDHQRNTEQAIQ